jgi:probable rRNA maturation factor
MPPYQVDVRVDFTPPPAAEDRVREAVLATLAQEYGEGETGVTILLCDEATIRSLNHQFMGEDKVTDVLSFPAGDPTPGTENYLGDIAISVPVASAEAEKAQIPVNVELQLLAIHGTLHLLSFDHSESGERRSMWRAQIRILANLGIEYAAPP